MPHEPTREEVIELLDEIVSQRGFGTIELMQRYCNLKQEPIICDSDSDYEWGFYDEEIHGPIEDCEEWVMRPESAPKLNHA